MTINLLEIFLRVFDLLYLVGAFVVSFWWIYIPWLLFILARDLWIKWRRQLFLRENDHKCVLLEVIPPRGIVKTARAMEQFFAGLHGFTPGANLKDKYWKGLLPDHWSFEIVSQGGHIHFLIRTQKKHRDFVEANIYAQYPEAEIREVDDYIHSVPADLPNKEYDLWGSEIILTKEDAYPIRTYVDYERGVVDKEQRIDPIAGLLELFNKIFDGEQLWLQILARPVHDDWKEGGEKIVQKMIGREVKKTEGLLKSELKGWSQAVVDVGKSVATGEPYLSVAQAEKPAAPPSLTVYDNELIKAIINNIGKVGYELVIRFVYIAPAEIYRGTVVKKALLGAFKQFNVPGLNGFKLNGKISPGIDYQIQFKRPRDRYRKKRVFRDYRQRYFTEQSKYVGYLGRPLFYERLPILNWFFVRTQSFVLNIEELATIYHFPVLTVKAPLTPKVEARKAEPPIGLPIQE